ACGVLVESHACKVDGLVSSACRVHSGPVTFVCDKAKSDHTVGFAWSSEPSGVTGDTMTNLVSVANFQPGTYEVKCTVACKRNRWATSRTTHAVALLNVYDCTTPPLVMSVYENEWHIPTNMPATCGAPERVYIGFDHAKVNTRNLSRIPVGDLDEDVSTKANTSTITSQNAPSCRRARNPEPPDEQEKHRHVDSDRHAGIERLCIRCCCGNKSL
ncbi:MAG: hypothetical protein GX615_01280, partial [Lentisphaerae bacterium]|nr:hypothetical protein [Lentisphaerota bacterium]